jgi:hypothetical protein
LNRDIPEGIVGDQVRRHLLFNRQPSRLGRRARQRALVRAVEPDAPPEGAELVGEWLRVLRFGLPAS